MAANDCGPASLCPLSSKPGLTRRLFLYELGALSAMLVTIGPVLAAPGPKLVLHRGWVLRDDDLNRLDIDDR
jgi:hypothetical protein